MIVKQLALVLSDGSMIKCADPEEMIQSFHLAHLPVTSCIWISNRGNVTVDTLEELQEFIQDYNRNK